jgi:hypothetical protein
MGKENMTGNTFHDELVKTVSKDDAMLINVLKTFVQELSDEISELLSDKVTNETALLVAHTFEQFATSIKKKPSLEAMALLGLFESNICMEHQKIMVAMPKDKTWRTNDE